MRPGVTRRSMKSRSGRLFAMALAQRARRRNRGSMASPRGVTASRATSAVSMPASAWVTLSIRPAQPFEALADLLLEPLLGRLVEAIADQRIGKVRLAGDEAPGVIGRILVAVAVAFVAHQT